MALLRDLLTLNSAGSSLPNPPTRMLNVYNVNTETVTNGGQACTWIVPDDVTWVGVEMWGGGGSGGGAVCCCTGGPSGGNGAYARKLMTVTPGDTYTICAGGTTACPAGLTGCAGFPSYMCKLTTSCMTAAGGNGGQTCYCWTCGFCSPCINPEPVAGFTGASFGICGTKGMSKQGCQSMCHNMSLTSGAPFGIPNLIFGRNYCCHSNGSEHMCGVLFPGGGGMSANSICCCYYRCGGIGAGGLVSLVYYSDTSL